MVDLTRSDGAGSGRTLEARRRAAVAEVEAHRPADASEAIAKAETLCGLSELADPFSEDAATVHVTGSGIVVGPRGTVLHFHRRLQRWLQPGGHVDPGESPAEAALRESREETGLEVEHSSGGPRLIHVDVHEAANNHIHLDLRYLLAAPDVDPAPPPGESPDARWFGWDEAIALADAGLVAALRQAQSALVDASVGKSEHSL